jgi:hypothetical protein
MRRIEKKSPCFWKNLPSRKKHKIEFRDQHSRHARPNDLSIGKFSDDMERNAMSFLSFSNASFSLICELLQIYRDVIFSKC